jgi:alkylhydroperoxidase family enzyme
MAKKQVSTSKLKEIKTALLWVKTYEQLLVQDRDKLRKALEHLNELLEDLTEGVDEIKDGLDLIERGLDRISQQV